MRRTTTSKERRTEIALDNDGERLVAKVEDFVGNKEKTRTPAVFLCEEPNTEQIPCMTTLSPVRQA